MTKEPDRTIVPGIRQIEARHLPEVERELLPNGVELVVLDSGVQPVSRITFGWAAGSVDVDDCAAYNLMCQMLTEGSVHHSGAEISDIFETMIIKSTAKHTVADILLICKGTFFTIYLSPKIGNI